MSGGIAKNKNFSKKKKKNHYFKIFNEERKIKELMGESQEPKKSIKNTAERHRRFKSTEKTIYFLFKRINRQTLRNYRLKSMSSSGLQRSKR